MRPRDVGALDAGQGLLQLALRRCLGRVHQAFGGLQGPLDLT